MAIIKHYNNYWTRSWGHKSPRLAVWQSDYWTEHIKYHYTVYKCNGFVHFLTIWVMVETKVKLSMQQAMEAHGVVRCQASHILLDSRITDVRMP
jgi:hypothetical protein